MQIYGIFPLPVYTCWSNDLIFSKLPPKQHKVFCDDMKDVKFMI